MDSPPSPDEALLDALFKAGAIALPTSERVGWVRSQIDGQQREYIIQREDVIRALNVVQSLPWQSVNCGNRALSLAMIENATHAIKVLSRAMTENEEKMIL